MKCFISGKYSVILPWPLPIEAEKGRRWCPCPWAHLGFLLPETAPLPVSTPLKEGPQSLCRLFTASKGFFVNLADSGSFFKATLNCWRTRLEFEILVFEFEILLSVVWLWWLLVVVQEGVRRLEVDLRLCWFDGKLFKFVEDLQSELLVVVTVVELQRSLVWEVQSNSEEPAKKKKKYVKKQYKVHYEFGPIHLVFC